MIRYRNLRVSVYSETLLRVEYQPQQLFENRPTLAMGTRLPPEIPVETEAQASRLIVRTPQCQLVYEERGEDFFADRLEVAYRHGDETRTWDLQTQHSQPVPVVYRSLDQWDREVKPYPVPIIINPDGWHAIVDNAGAYWDEQAGWPRVQRPPYYQNYFLFFYGRDIRQAFRDFTTLFGPVPLLPRQAFGAWYSRWYDFKDEELLDLIRQYRHHDLPLDVLVIDVDWHTHHWNGYDWRQGSFPDPPAFIAAVKEAGLRLVLNDHPGYDLADPLPAGDTHLPALQEALAEPPYKGMWACDWSRRSVADRWSRHCLQDLLRQGIDWWWIDGWGDTPFPEVDGQFWLNWQYYRATQELNPDKRVLILSRWGGLGSHRYPIQFSGDTHSTFANLQFQVRYTAISGGLGAAYWSHDVGGFHEGEIDEEVYVRWVQCCALSPIFRTHSNHGIREPYKFSARALAIYRKYLHLRYLLIPYLEQLHCHHHRTGFPPLYPMDFVFPDHELATRFHEQYFFGPALLVAPVTEAVDEATGRREKSVWLPPGEWLDLVRGDWLAGDRVVTRGVDLAAMPLFLRRGMILPTMPMQAPLPRGRYPEVIFQLIGPVGEREETFYFDDGETIHNFALDQVSKVTVSYRVQGDRMELRLDIDPGYSRACLPARLGFSCYPRQVVSAIKFNDENVVSQLSGPHLLALLGLPALSGRQWSLAAAELAESNLWIIEFSPQE